MSDQEQKVKVSDRRMFTPDGELREEYRFLEDKDREKPQDAEEPKLTGASSGAPDVAGTPSGPLAGAPILGEAVPAGPLPGGPVPGRPTPGEPPPGGGVPSPAPGGPAAGEADPGGPPLELPSNAGQPGAPGFMDLVAMLAEPASIYLGDAPLPDGRTHEDLDMARVHIDLLDVLRQKTAGNLSARESTVLEDVVYQLKMRYVRKQG